MEHGSPLDKIYIERTSPPECGGRIFRENMKEDNMKITLELDEQELAEHVYETAAKQYLKEFSTDRRHVNMIVDDEIRKIIYADKDRIVDRIVDRASRECTNKAVKKILDGALEKG